MFFLKLIFFVFIIWYSIKSYDKILHYSVQRADNISKLITFFGVVAAFIGALGGFLLLFLIFSGFGNNDYKLYYLFNYSALGDAFILFAIYAFIYLSRIHFRVNENKLFIEAYNLGVRKSAPKFPDANIDDPEFKIKLEKVEKYYRDYILDEYKIYDIEDFREKRRRSQRY